MPRTATVHAVTAIGIDMGKNTLHMVGLDGDALRCSQACRAWPRCEAGPSRVFEAFSAGAKK
jgi:hypothetical protein